MIRWVLVIFIVLVVFSNALSWLEKLGIGRLPGDVKFTLLGRKIHLPFASTLLIAAVVMLIAHAI